jgi:heme/copper-type cytochrome/quinol oxidase subunit 4
MFLYTFLHLIFKFKNGSRIIVHLFTVNMILMFLFYIIKILAHENF